MIDIVDRLQNNHRDLHGDDYTIAMFADRKEAAALISSLRGEIERLREIIRQNCNGDVVSMANPNSAMPIDYKAAFERTAKSLDLSNKAMRECQLLLCVQEEWGDCAKHLEAGERCACGFEDGPFANAVPQNREANQLRARVAELEKELNPFAAIADRAEEMGWKSDISVLYVTLGLCRRARAVLDAGRT